MTLSLKLNIAWEGRARDLIARHSPKVWASRNRIRKLLAAREVVQHWHGGPDVLTHDDKEEDEMFSRVKTSWHWPWSCVLQELIPVTKKILWVLVDSLWLVKTLQLGLWLANKWPRCILSWAIIRVKTLILSCIIFSVLNRCADCYNRKQYNKEPINRTHKY